MNNLYYCEGCAFFTEYNANGYIGVCGTNELPTADKMSCAKFLALEDDQDYVPPKLIVLPAKPIQIYPANNFETESIVTNMLSQRRRSSIRIDDLIPEEIENSSDYDDPNRDDQSLPLGGNLDSTYNHDW
jgi:hypothetical protein